MEIEKLSDDHLYTLVQSNDLSPDLRQIVLKEFKNRNYTIEQLDVLGLRHESASSGTSKPYTGLQKVLIIAVPFFPVIHAILANRNISRGNQLNWKQHWRFVGIGYFLWTILAILIGKFILFAN